MRKKTVKMIEDVAVQTVQNDMSRMGNLSRKLAMLQLVCTLFTLGMEAETTCSYGWGCYQVCSAAEKKMGQSDDEEAGTGVFFTDLCP